MATTIVWDNLPDGEVHLQVAEDGSITLRDPNGTESPLGGGAGGGGVTVDNTVDEPVAVTSIVASGATFDGDVATLPASSVEVLKATVALTDAQIKALPT